MSIYKPNGRIWNVTNPSGIAAQAAGGWWEVDGQTCVAAYQPIGAASLAASYVNLANPGTYDVTVGNALDNSDVTAGWVFNGINDYLIMPIAPSDEGSILVRFSNASGANSYLVGVYHSSGKQFGIVPILNTSPPKVQYESEATLAVAPPATGGVLGIAGRKAYRDGTEEAGSIKTGTVATGNIYIGARNRADTSGVDGRQACKIQAIAIYSTTLSPADVAALTNRMAALS